MPLDAQVAAFLHASAALGLPAYETLSPAEARALYVRVMEARRGPGYVPEPVAAVEDTVVRLGTADLRLRTYQPLARTPGEQPPTPVVAFFHGGGFVIGDVDTHDGIARTITAGVGAIVVSVDYRLAPEHPFPAAVQDAAGAIAWVAEHAAELGGDPQRLAVAGDSAGGNLAAVAARRARDAGGPTIAAQFLAYPVTDCAMGSGSYREHATGYGLTAATMGWYLGHYGGSGDDPDASPLACTDLAGLPPAVVTTAEHDPLRDEGDAYAAALTAAGVEVRHLPHPGLVHGYLGMVAIPAGRAAIAEDLAALAALLAR